MKITPRANQCTAMTRAGVRCTASCWGSRKTCNFHVKDKDYVKALQSKGGRRRAKFDLSELAELPKPRTAADVKALLSTVLIEVRTGKLDTKTSANLAYVAGHLLQAIALEDLEKEIVEVLKAPNHTNTLDLPPLPEGAELIGPELPPKKGKVN